MRCYIECSSGIAGNMLVGSLLDLGVDWERFRKEIGRLNIGGYELIYKNTAKNGIRAKLFEVRLTDPNQPERNLSDIEQIILGSHLKESVKNNSIAIFRKLAEVESLIHQKPISEIHFHEVGAIDSIIDIVGACICFDILNIEKIYYSPIVIGSGSVESTHGKLPVPAPATAKLLEGKLIYQSDIKTELTTPTGAAIITTLGTQLAQIPEMKLIKVGYGAGIKSFPERPNILRIFLGNEAESVKVLLDKYEADEIVEISFNIDDMTGEQIGYFVEKILSCGVLDVSIIPIYTKKTRPAQKIEVLCFEQDFDKVLDVIFENTSTFGVRFTNKKRFKLTRETKTIELDSNKVNVKIGKIKDKVVRIKPEYEDIKKLADVTNKGINELQVLAIEKFKRERMGGDGE